MISVILAKHFQDIHCNPMHPILSHPILSYIPAWLTKTGVLCHFKSNNAVPSVADCPDGTAGTEEILASLRQREKRRC
jgi:hypothetical protein